MFSKHRSCLTVCLHGFGSDEIKSLYLNLGGYLNYKDILATWPATQVSGDKRRRPLVTLWRSTVHKLNITEQKIRCFLLQIWTWDRNDVQVLWFQSSYSRSHAMAGLPIWLFWSQILKFCLFLNTFRFFWLFFCRKGLALEKHCQSCIYITNLFWKESITMQSSQDIEKKLTFA